MAEQTAKPLPPLTPAEDARWLAEFRAAWARLGGCEWEARMKRQRRDLEQIWGRENVHG